MQLSWTERVERVMDKLRLEDDSFRQWMMERENLGYLFDYFLYRRCFNIWKRIRRNGDHFTVICGGEGSGKSTLACQIAATISPQSFGKQSVCWSIDEFLGRVLSAKIGDSLILDEGAMLLYSMDTQTKEGKAISKVFQRMRELNLNIIICIPRFFDISAYVRTHRVDLVLWIPVKGRHNYKAYRDSAIDKINDKRKMNIVPKSGTYWQGYWNKIFPSINGYSWEEYTKDKRQDLLGYIKEVKSEMGSNTKEYMSIKEVADSLGLDRTGLWKKVKEGSIEAIRVGKVYRIHKNTYESLRNPPKQPK